MKSKKYKQGEIVSGKLIKWILYLAILVTAVFAIKNMIGRFGG